MATPNQPRDSDIDGSYIDERKMAGRKTPPQQRTTADDETNPTAEENGFFVYYRYIASLEGRQSRLLRIYVNEGDNIDSITKRIKNMNHFFASVSAEQMEMYESIEQETPLPSFNLH